jgi:hypothetical protein
MTRNDLIEALVERTQEDKWKRMKGHIAASARARGISGERYNAYVYGAMRARGWKPKRERVDETIDTIGRVAKRVGGKLHKEFKREVVRPVKSTMRARRYKLDAGRRMARGDVGRGLEMDRRAHMVLKRHAPALIAAPIGYSVGLASAVPGGAEIGAVVSAKTARRIARRRRAA